MKFYIGLHNMSHAQHFDRAFISVNRIRKRKKKIDAREWIMDSGAFSEVSKYGGYRSSVDDYAAVIERWAVPGSGLIAAVSQDYMCEAWILEKTGLTVADHQRLTIERYDALLAKKLGVYIMPVLQGYTAAEYLAHIEMYGDRLAPGAYVGVGSICKRNASASSIEAVLCAIKRRRPDIRLHGFGLKITALASGLVRDSLHSSDSMAWNFAARKQGKNQEDWQVAKMFADKIEHQQVQCAWAF